MKNYIPLSSLLFVLAASSLLSCSDDDQTFPEENPLQEYLTEAGFTEVFSTVDDGDYEFGITFVPKEKGNITQVVVKLPDDQTDLRVTIWDAENQTVLKTITIPTVTADTEMSQSITPLTLEKDHEYMITFNSDDYYIHERPDGMDITYPITAGNISITGYGYSEGFDQVFPSGFYDDYYAGDLSFVFQQTE